MRGWLQLVIAALVGFETMSMALSWTLGVLAGHPDVMHRLEQVGCTMYRRGSNSLICMPAYTESVGPTP
jgi:cytochrome P450